MLVTSHAERVCGEYRRALCVLHSLRAWGQSAKNIRKCRNIIFFSFVLWTITRGLGRGGSYIWSETQSIRLLSGCGEASGNWGGEATCCEYRREQLLTPTAHQSAVSLDKAKRRSLRRNQLYIGLSPQPASHPLSIDAYWLGKYLHLIFLFYPEVKTGSLPSVPLEAHREPIDLPREKNKKNKNPTRRDPSVSLTCCKLFYLDWTYYGFVVSEIHREDQHDQFLPAPTWGQPPSRWTGCRRGKRSEEPSVPRRWQTSRPVPQEMLAGGWGCKILILYLSA